MITVIVPVYNVEKYLNQCIESIINQTYTDLEILLIDDGSTDQSGFICDYYAKIDERIRVFHQVNMGVSCARNIGIEHAKGEWINFIDSDDWISHDYYEKMMQDEELADLTFWGFSRIYTEGSQTDYRLNGTDIISREEIEAHLAHLKKNQQGYEYLGFTFNKLFKSSIIKKNGIRFIKNLSIYEDEVFTLTYAIYAQTLRIKPYLSYNYRILETGLSHRIKRYDEYRHYANTLSNLLHNFNNSFFLTIEENCIFGCLFIGIKSCKPFTKSWFSAINLLVQKGRLIKRKYQLYSKKHCFKYDLFLYQYVMIMLHSIIIRIKNN